MDFNHAKHQILRGVYPPTTMALFPPFSRLPIFCHPSPPSQPPYPRKQFLDILYAILCNFMRVFSELWKLAVRVMTPNQTVNDAVAHSKNPRKFAYHVTFDLDLDLEHTLDAGLPADHRVQVWWRSGHLPARRSDFRASTKVPVSRDL